MIEKQRKYMKSDENELIWPPIKKRELVKAERKEACEQPREEAASSHRGAQPLPTAALSAPISSVAGGRDLIRPSPLIN